MVVGIFAIGFCFYLLTGQTKKSQPRIEPLPTMPGTETAPPPLSDKQIFEEKLVANGLDPTLSFPYWPLVYFDYNGETFDAHGFIKGTIKNCSSYRVGLIRVSFDIYDDAGNKLGSASDFVGDLGPGETWAYKCYATDGFKTFRGPYIDNRDIEGDPR